MGAGSGKSKRVNSVTSDFNNDPNSSIPLHKIVDAMRKKTEVDPDAIVTQELLDEIISDALNAEDTEDES